MSPELDRLVAAAEGAYQDARLPNEVLSQRTTQAIVRAVLMALREVSDDGFDAMEQALKRPRQHVGHKASDEVRGAYIALDAYVDHILGTRDRRAAALQDLADIDRDLL